MSLFFLIFCTSAEGSNHHIRFEGIIDLSKYLYVFQVLDWKPISLQSMISFLSEHLFIHILLIKKESFPFEQYLVSIVSFQATAILDCPY